MSPYLSIYKPLRVSILSILVLLCFTIGIHAQIITSNPRFPLTTPPDSVTLYYDATQGDQGLKGFTGTVYAHTGLITNISTGPTNWLYTIAPWATNTAQAKMKRIAPNLYSLRMQIRGYYGDMTNDTIKNLAFVFRDSVGALTGRGPGGADIHYNVCYAGELAAGIYSPVVNGPLIVAFNSTTPIKYYVNQAANVTLTDNGNVITTYTGVDSVWYNYLATATGTHIIKFKATAGALTRSDSIVLAVNPTVTHLPLPAGVKTGVNYINDSTVTLVLTAPYKKYAYVIGEFNKWLPDSAYFMHYTPDSEQFWVTISHLIPQKEYAYQFFIDGSLTVGDPYCDKILDPANDPYISIYVYPNLKPYPAGVPNGSIVSVLQTAQTPFVWKYNSNWTPPAVTKLNIYELHVPEFITSHAYQDLADTIQYLKRMGVNAIELMPIMEFDGNLSWGYNPSYYFAPDKYYGTKNALKHFIDSCHSQGIAVILDVAMNDAWGSCAMVQMYWNAALGEPAANSPWFNQVAKHPFNVGYDFNHESPYTKKLFHDVTRHWLTEYNVDGFRFDLATGYTQFNSGTNVGLWQQYDTGRINIWKGYIDSMKAVKPAMYPILEYFCSNTELTVVANYGGLIWTNLATASQQSGMGYNSNSDMSADSYKNLGWNAAHNVAYMESHDEQRVMYQCEAFGAANGAYKVRDTATALTRVAALANVFFAVPGPKMEYEFGEVGYDVSDAYGGGNTSPKPINWNYYKNWQRYGLYKEYQAMMHMRDTNSVFQTTNFTNDLGNSNLTKRVNLYSTATGMMDAVAMSNLNVVSENVIPYFEHTGTWYEFYTHTTLNVTSTAASYTLSLQPGEYRLYTDGPMANPDLGVQAPVEGSANVMNTNVYPNPAQSYANVEFAINQSAKVRITLVDISGNTVMTLFDATAQPGAYEARIQTSDLASGTYLVVFNTGNETHTQKLMVTK